MSTHQRQVEEGRRHFEAFLQRRAEEHFEANKIDVDYAGRHSDKIVYLWRVMTPAGRSLVIGATERAIDDPEQLGKTFSLLDGADWIEMALELAEKDRGLLVSTTAVRPMDLT